MFLTETAAAGAGGLIVMVVWMVILFGIMYLLMIRPQKKEQKRLKAMLADMAVGDAVEIGRASCRERVFRAV